MELFILRHAIAEAIQLGSPMRDRDRALTPEGIRKMQRIAKAMAALDLTFDRILTSPYRRARETADIAAAALGLTKKPELMPELAAGGSTRTLVHALRERYPSSKSLLLVGHEPDLSSLIARLIAGSSEVTITMKKAGLCKLTVGSLRYGRCATLEWLLVPSQSTRIK